MNILPFRKRQNPPVEAPADFDLPEDAKRYYEKRGIKFKDRSVSHVLIREDGPNTYRVMCLDCTTQFDLFGVLKPADAMGESEVIVKIMEHLGRCSDRKNPKSTFVARNKHTPIYKLTVEWCA